MDFTHSGFIKMDEIIANKEEESFNDGGFVRDRQCWKGENDAESRHCNVSSWENWWTVLVKTWGKVKVTYCKGEENLVERDRLVVMEVEFVEKAKDGNDTLNTVKVHAKVGDVVIQVGHRYPGLHRVLFKLNPRKMI